ncbi:poly(A) RNA polymerase, mitochondrial-like [Lingula anatina]|uniref:Poly(A) RNA polymerase, mitochondrial-like n=1 Tax=Lingula anatina TaxID=7574 RepID=A0A1S3I1R5_LINAN|nr:poly(A) RNA polymerase, mitochondrial-like [Lingula anatina]|eukprot:XP_013392207.1 poly(A) RNA polymerase, mitochondrial-like [Lingula anatina]
MQDSQYALVVFQQDEAVHSFQETALHPAKMPISRQQIFLPEKYLSGLPVGEVHEELRPQKKKPMEKVYNDLHFAKDGITGQIDLLYNSLKVQDTDILKRCFVRGQMQHLLEKFFPHLAVQPFGSTMCGLSSAYSSDLDLYLVDLKNGSGDDLSSTVLPQNRALIDMPSELAIIGNLLPAWSSHLKAVQFVLGASIPLLKLRHNVLNLDIDLCGQKAQSNGKHISKLLHTFAGLDARVKPLVLVIKEVAQQLKIVRYPQPNPTMTNFMVTALVVSFLQTRTPSILPSAEYADSLHNERNQSSLFVSQNSNTTGDLLLEFFQHYHKFNFLCQGLSIDLGQTVKLAPPSIKPGISCTLYGNNLCRNKNKMDYLKFFRMSCEHALRVLEKPFDNSMEPWGLEALLKTKNPLRTQQKKRLPQVILI